MVKRLLLATACLVLLATVHIAAASTVRGYVFRQAPNGAKYPAPRVMLVLVHQQWGRSSPAYSGEDGFYYFYNVPPGVYTLEVWVNPQSVMRFTVTVTYTDAQHPYSDIAPIRVG